MQVLILAGGMGFLETGKLYSTAVGVFTRTARQIEGRNETICDNGVDKWSIYCFPFIYTRFAHLATLLVASSP